MVDIRERYPFTFADRQATIRREPLSAGDYGLLVDGRLQETVERKSLADLVSWSATPRSSSSTTASLAAAQVALFEEMVGELAVRGLEAAPTLAPAPPAPADVRRWAARNDIVVSGRGRIPAAVMDQYLEARARGAS
ncbi:Lsr2 family DNA-binding protein [Nocardioides ochotonae]|uniref:Lsr2 family DNA-binding protein n=1 Tax=Nocardioides ochotonae TaxID=2685869 RepID=UPI001A9F4E98|nr:histone-like nucleoid-structuring protein Lsr2 [Nocardioides ochotonae]